MSDQAATTQTSQTTTTPPPTINLSVDEFQRYRKLESDLAELHKAKELELQAKESERLKAIGEKEGVEKALAEQQKAWETKHAESQTAYRRLETQVFDAERERVIAQAFEGLTFAGDTPEQKAFAAAAVRREIAEDLEVSRDAAGALVVRQKGTGLAAAGVIKERLANPRYAGILAASTRPGAGGGGDKPGLNTGKPPEAGSVAERVQKFMNDRTQAWGLSAKSK